MSIWMSTQHVQVTVVGADAGEVMRLKLQWLGTCSGCGVSLAAGTWAAWEPASRQITCASCLSVTSAADNSCLGDALVPVVEGVGATEALTPAPAGPLVVEGRAGPGPRAVNAAGGSAQREFDRRATARAVRVRGQHPRLGGLLLALTGEAVTTRVWAQGAAGERVVAQTLQRHLGAAIFVLHDRRLRRPDGRLSTANVDHVIVCANGVWVVDTKTHHGRLKVKRGSGLPGARVRKLIIDGRDQTRLLEGLAGQRDAVTRVLDGHGIPAGVPVHGALCFVGTDLPWRSGRLDDVELVSPRGLVRRVRRPGLLTEAQQHLVFAVLEEQLPPAT